MTSHDVVSRLRRIYGEKRIGHAGTLDPGATGLLVLAIGNVTRLLDYFQAKTKRYVGEVVFGIETDSYDSDGTVISRTEVARLDSARVQESVLAMTGEISQMPPEVSAIKVKGKKLYEYHRENLAVEIKPRRVRIDSISYSMTAEANVIRIDVVCSPGTYIRSIAHDLGAALGTGAHLANLRRLESGSFNVQEAFPLEEVVSGMTLSPALAFRDFTVVSLNGEQAARARVGSKVVIPDQTSDEILVFDGSEGPFVNWDQLIGLYRRDNGDSYRAGIILPVIN
ncbi:MAG: tRNA pseudouridine(55) synthase TruB [Actinomycetota bacterium]|nr:MAG: tRNA pseudouridine(55) synthase TruB [Actinomycetota bacterium]